MRFQKEAEASGEVAVSGGGAHWQRGTFSMGVCVSSSGFWVPVFRFRVSGVSFGCRISDFGFRVSGVEFRVLGFELRDTESPHRLPQALKLSPKPLPVPASWKI